MSVFFKRLMFVLQKKQLFVHPGAWNHCAPYQQVSFNPLFTPLHEIYKETQRGEKKQKINTFNCHFCHFYCTDDDRAGSNSSASGSSSIFIPDVKSRTLGSDSLFDLSEHDQSWEFKGKKAGGAAGGWSSGVSPNDSAGASAAPQKTLPEQLKVFKGDDLGGYKPSSPKSRRMLYSGSSHSSSSRPSFPGSFFPLESSPRHQRRAVNISEPFAVSVPLRVSAVISSNSTPCRVHSKDKTVALKPCKEPSEQSSSGKSNTFPKLEPKKQEGTEKKSPAEVLTSGLSPQGEDNFLCAFLTDFFPFHAKFLVQSDIMENIICYIQIRAKK